MSSWASNSYGRRDPEASPPRHDERARRSRYLDDADGVYGRGRSPAAVRHGRSPSPPPHVYRREDRSSAPSHAYPPHNRYARNDISPPPTLPPHYTSHHHRDAYPSRYHRRNDAAPYSPYAVNRTPRFARPAYPEAPYHSRSRHDDSTANRYDSGYWASSERDYRRSTSRHASPSPRRRIYPSPPPPSYPARPYDRRAEASPHRSRDFDGRTSRAAPHAFDSRRPPRRAGIVERGTEEDRLASKTLFVGSLPYNFVYENVVQLFEPCGRLAKVTVPIDRITGRNKGFAFVEFEDRKDAEKAQAKFNGFQIEDRRLKVDWDIGIDKKTHLKPPTTNSEANAEDSISAGQEQNRTSETFYAASRTNNEHDASRRADSGGWSDGGDSRKTSSSAYLAENEL